MSNPRARFAARLACALLAAAAAGLLARGDDPATPRPAGPAARLSAEALEGALDPYLREAADGRRFSGVALVAQDGKPLFRKAYGHADWTKRVPNTPETGFMLFSISKQFTAAAVLLLQDRGRLSVQDPVSKHLPDCPPEWAPVTLHHLLSHTAGIEIDNLWHWIENHYPALREDPRKEPAPYQRMPLVTPPGEKFQYSNGGYMLLAQVVAKASGRGYQEFLRENVFRPLGMAGTDCDRDAPTPGRARGHHLTPTDAKITEQPTHYVVGAGDVYSTADDMLRWDEALYTDKLLSARAREAMFTPHARSKRGGYGYAWVVRLGPDGRLLQQHGGAGGGFVAYVVRRPREHVYLAVLCNLESDGEYPYFNGCLERVDRLLYPQAGAGKP
jgi:CubicO group peptidase (beta-lactamase class C family)